jgi:type I restriction enzyme S subunit
VTPEEQARQEIDRQLAACGWVVQNHKAMNIMAGRLRQSIRKRAFEGQLVPQDPNDEPASVLLERIRNARAAESPQRAHKRRKSPA